MIKFLYDFIPVLLFFAVFRFCGIYAATVTGIVATGLQVVIQYLWKKSVDKQQLLTFVVFVVFGGLTLYLHNPIFIKWKPTVVFWIMALVFFGSQFVGEKPLLQRMLENSLEGSELERKAWQKLNSAWAIFFALLGGINLLVAYHYSTSVWVSFKFYGISGLLLLFCLGQAIFLSRYIAQKR